MIKIDRFIIKVINVGFGLHFCSFHTTTKFRFRLYRITCTCVPDRPSQAFIYLYPVTYNRRLRYQNMIPQ